MDKGNSVVPVDIKPTRTNQKSSKSSKHLITIYEVWSGEKGLEFYN